MGTTIGLLAGARISVRLQHTLTDALGLFTLVIGITLALQFTLAARRPVIGELLRLSDHLDALGVWLQRRIARGEKASRISEGFVTASLVFCVGPLTILGSIQNGLTGDCQLLAVKSLLDAVASTAFAAALGFGVYLSALTVLIVQGPIAFGAWLLGSGLDQASIDAASAVGGILLLGVGLRLLEIRQVRIVDMLRALLLAPIFVHLLAALGAARG
ncbi:MAG TPA: DUF554 family protein [Thermomicrobiales bacterium]|nr:DUF554 family protein [Thermomicrobiales bacterium]